jgi:hypothetical protein
MDRRTFRVSRETFQLDSLLKSLIQGWWVILQEFVSDGWFEVGDEKIQCHVVKSCRGSVTHEVLCSSSTVGNRDGDELGNGRKGGGPRDGRDGEGSIRDESFQVVDGLDDAGVVTND